MKAVVLVLLLEDITSKAESLGEVSKAKSGLDKIQWRNTAHSSEFIYPRISTKHTCTILVDWNLAVTNKHSPYLLSHSFNLLISQHHAIWN